MKYVIYIRVGNKTQLDYITKKTKTETRKKIKDEKIKLKTAAEIITKY